jgi:Superinfection immunity protein
MGFCHQSILSTRIVNGMKITGVFARPGETRDQPCCTKIAPSPIGFCRVRYQKVHSDSSKLKRPTMLAYPSFAVASATSFPAIANSWLVGSSLAAIYFAPALVAFFRRQQNRWFILVLNFLFGWTIVGWIICLAWGARAPAGEQVIVVQTVPPAPSRPLTFFQGRPGSLLTPTGSNARETISFQTKEIFDQRPPQSFKMVVVRLAIAAISIAIVVGVTASQWKGTNPLTVSHPKRLDNHLPQIRNIDPYVPGPSNAVPKRHYPPMPARSHEGYY